MKILSKQPKPPLDTGYQLDKVQRGEQPIDFKPMPSIGKGVEEIRVWDDMGIYRVIYTARLTDARFMCCMHTSKRDIELAKSRYTQLTRGTK
jgi:phage-related protein